MNIFGEDHSSLWAIETGEKSGKSMIALIVPEGTDGASEFKPMRHKQKLHDDIGYYSSYDGRVLSISTNTLYFPSDCSPLVLSASKT